MLLVLLALAWLTAGRAAALRIDLGDGLTYFRVHQLPADLPPAATPPGPMVVDLRFVPLSPADRAAVSAWIRFRAAAATPVLVLVNGGTAPGLASIFAEQRGLPGLLTLGLPAPDYTPDLVVKTTAEADRRGYDALEQGMTVTALITENAGKPRNDEASIVRDRVDPATEPPPEGDTPDGAATSHPDAKPAIVDSTLQRAVQGYRALRALRRI